MLKFKNITGETVLVRLKVGDEKTAVKADQIVEVEDHRKNFFEANKSVFALVTEEKPKKSK